MELLQFATFIISILPLLLFSVFFDENKIEAQRKYQQKLELLGEEDGIDGNVKGETISSKQCVGDSANVVRMGNRAYVNRQFLKETLEKQHAESQQSAIDACENAAETFNSLGIDKDELVSRLNSQADKNVIKLRVGDETVVFCDMRDANAYLEQVGLDNCKDYYYFPRTSISDDEMRIEVERNGDEWALVVNGKVKHLYATFTEEQSRAENYAEYLAKKQTKRKEVDSIVQ